LDIFEKEKNDKIFVTAFKLLLLNFNKKEQTPVLMASLAFV